MNGANSVKPVAVLYMEVKHIQSSSCEDEAVAPSATGNFLSSQLHVQTEGLPIRYRSVSDELSR